MSRKAVVIGAGFGGLSTAALLAREGLEVTLVEKNEGPGGRARVWRKDGFVFDMGPSWYLMPEVFEDFFELFGKRREDYYRLVRVDPYYRVFFGKGERADVTPDIEATKRLFETFEPGAGPRLGEYLAAAQYKYDTAMTDFLYREYRHLFQFFNHKLAARGLKLDIFSSLDRSVRRFFSDRRARQILEYAMVFLGASPDNAPALYSIMSHVDLTLGVWYPDGGLGSIVKGLERLGTEQGVKFVYDCPATGFRFEGKRITAVRTAKGEFAADLVVNNADYHHVDRELLPPERAAYSEAWWNRRVVAPSMFILYLGIEGRVPELVHHNLYFQEDWRRHFSAISKEPAWPDDPCFYLSCPSRSDPSVAPAGMENLFVLVPVAAGLPDGDAVREHYAALVLQHVERVTGMSIKDRIRVRRIFSQRDFAADYHAFRGTALGLAHTLGQTAIFRPATRSRKLRNLVFAGQYPHPGVGVPMTLIASRLAVDAALGTDLAAQGRAREAERHKRGPKGASKGRGAV